MCKGRGKITPASCVDHIIPHKGNEDLFYSYDNTQSLCSHHHASIKQSHELTRFTPTGADGWPIG